MVFPILVRCHLYIESGPCYLFHKGIAIKIFHNEPELGQNHTDDASSEHDSGTALEYPLKTWSCYDASFVTTMTMCGATSDNKVGIMKALFFSVGTESIKLYSQVKTSWPQCVSNL